MSKRQLPEVRIKNAWLLREHASVHLHELFAKKGDGLADYEELNEVVDKYKKSWDPVEQKILNAMCDITGLEFRQNTLDVFIAPWFYAFSDPMVIGIMMEGDEFVRNLTHEMIHRIITDNTSLPYYYDYIAAWQKLYGKNHNWNTLVHIPVHAVHKAIIYDVLKDPSIKDADYNMCLEFGGPEDDYIKSWGYVDKHGYKEIIEKLKTIYK